MFRDDISLSNVIYGFESTLRIDNSLVEINKIITNSIAKLENAYAVKLDKPLYEVQLNQRFNNAAITELVGQIEECCKNFSAIVLLAMYDKVFGETLQSVSYLGFERTELLKALKYLQDNDYYEEHSTFFYKIVNAMDTIPVCMVKRLFVIMIILEKLDVREGVSMVANYLYSGGVMIG